MTGFWLLVAVMILIPLVILLRTLMFPGKDKYTDNTTADVMIYQARVVELEKEVENGILTDEQAAAIRDDLKRTLLNETDTGVDAITINQTAKREKITAGILIIFLPVVAISVYLVLGTPGFEKQSQQPLISDDLESLESVEEMVEGLAIRLQNQPNDLEGWYMLAKSYMVLGNYNEAVNAYAHLKKISDPHPDILLGYANALALSNNGITSGKPEQLAKQALELDPGNSNGLWLVGMAAFEQGNFQIAVNSWQQLTGQMDKESPSYLELKKLIDYAELQLSENVAQDATVIPYKIFDEEVARSITVNVSLSDHLAMEIDPADTLFVFARALDGPPMPVAVVKKQVSELPLSVVLDDSTAMMEQRKLSAFDEVIVGARISRSGDAIPQAGDLTGTNVTVDLGKDEPVNIVIDQKIP